MQKPPALRVQKPAALTYALYLSQSSLSFMPGR